MIICEKTLREIGIYGTSISKEVRTHLTICDSCAEAYREEKELEHLLLSVEDLETPENLKPRILENARNRPLRKFSVPNLGFALKTVGILIIFISGFWLGLQTANNGKEIDNSISDDFNVIDASPYKLNTEPLYPENLSEIYFTVLKESKYGK
jgi:hypothetical protein